MNQSKENIAFLVSPAIYVLNQLGEIDLHKLFKILYFADKKHIAKYGRPMTKDTYHAMKKGPVPTILYDYIKTAAGKNTWLILTKEEEKEISKYFACKRMFVKALQEPELDFLSKSAIKCLENSIKEYSKKTHDQLTDLSHDSAYKATYKDAPIKIIDIAKDAGANSEMIKYIHENN